MGAVKVAKYLFYVLEGGIGPFYVELEHQPLYNSVVCNPSAGTEFQLTSQVYAITWGGN